MAGVQAAPRLLASTTGQVVQVEDTSSPPPRGTSVLSALAPPFSSPSPASPMGFGSTSAGSEQGVSSPPFTSCPMPLTSREPCWAVLRRSSHRAMAADGSMPTDEDSMTKAMRRKALLNAQLTPGMSSKSKSFLSLSNSQLSSKLFNVGVSLGRNEEEILVSANALRHMEIDRVRASPNAKCTPVNHSLDDDEATDTVDGQLLSHLVGEVSEVGLDEAMLGSIYDLQASSRKSKKNSDMKSIGHKM